MGLAVERDERDKVQFDPTRVINPDPKFKYRLLNTNRHNMARKGYKGWVVVTEGKEQLALDSSTPVKAGTPVDNTRGYSDVVLARMPVELYEERIAKPWREYQKHVSGAHERAYLQKVGGMGFVEKEGSKGSKYAGAMDESQFDALTAGKGA